MQARILWTYLTNAFNGLAKRIKMFAEKHTQYSTSINATQTYTSDALAAHFADSKTWKKNMLSMLMVKRSNHKSEDSRFKYSKHYLFLMK